MASQNDTPSIMTQYRQLIMFLTFSLSEQQQQQQQRMTVQHVSHTMTSETHLATKRVTDGVAALLDWWSVTGHVIAAAAASFIFQRQFTRVITNSNISSYGVVFRVAPCWHVIAPTSSSTATVLSSVVFFSLQQLFSLTFSWHLHATRSAADAICRNGRLLQHLPKKYRFFDDVEDTCYNLC